MMIEGSGPTQFERNWAMLAHLTTMLTVLAGFSTGGAGALVALLLPLGMYMYFRERSAYVAFHALQSTTFQVAACAVLILLTAGAALVLIGVWVITAMLSLAVVGVLLLPVAILLTLAAVLGLLGLPFVMLAYTVRGAYLTYTGAPFEYPWVGEMVARTMEARVEPSSAG